MRSQTAAIRHPYYAQQLPHNRGSALAHADEADAYLLDRPSGQIRRGHGSTQRWAGEKTAAPQSMLHCKPSCTAAA
jgi:hypothetical protein